MKWFDGFADKIIAWVGTPQSIMLHTIWFIGMFMLPFFGFDRDRTLSLFTNILSLEAIYLSLFIQLTVNRANKQLTEVKEDVADVQADVEEVSKDVDEISEDVSQIQEDVAEVQEDMEEVTKDVAEIQEDVEEVQEDVEELSDDDISEYKNYTKEELAEKIQEVSKQLEELKKHI
jgi:peptidoglycan hydrolase CwlO-like protein